ncbi:hypothetical protein [Leeuwenhoekiella nanhaiensis]|uniref:Lipoprotein n=1 Tax=Leeuwenhoekiella nanhaiensis TaxID=1655491 RepID=A0A2G1VT08_9FLAO|nr:hypothetical protein [Leeuwenhoekiella nanhaiensis]PHQ29923.1 hypothetical protein CJ305_08105 [Leeuwenhoekiella nanhaiensis]
MKSFKLILTLGLLLGLMACEKDDNPTVLEFNSLDFVARDGSALGSNPCFDPSKQYAVRIEATASGNGEVEPEVLDLTINGVQYSLTFKQRGVQTIPIQLISGENVAQISGTSQSARVYVVMQGDFELVE